jgi:phosphoglycolate phosphatase-like HAD superfamily hydrolase
MAWGIVTNKPARGFQQRCRLGIAPEHCWYVGDDLRDVEAGRAAGMATVACAWGYCGSIEPGTWGADYLHDTPADLLATLRGIIANAELVA